jgi:opacity protein-like surface antigen
MHKSVLAASAVLLLVNASPALAEAPLTGLYIGLGGQDDSGGHRFSPGPDDIRAHGWSGVASAGFNRKLWIFDLGLFGSVSYGGPSGDKTATLTPGVTLKTTAGRPITASVGAKVGIPITLWGDFTVMPYGSVSATGARVDEGSYYRVASNPSFNSDSMAHLFAFDPNWAAGLEVSITQSVSLSAEYGTDNTTLSTSASAGFGSSDTFHANRVLVALNWYPHF